MKRIQMLGVAVDGMTVDELHATIADSIRRHRQAAVLNVNVHALNLAAQQPEFRAILNSAAVVFCDGAGVRLGARILGHRLPPRITYADWIFQLAEFCSQEGFSLFLLGAQAGVAARAAERLAARFPHLKLAGHHHGFFNRTGPEQHAVIAEINRARPDILLVCLGMPIQEQWIAAHAAELRAWVFLSGGACLDYVAGVVPRGPRWMLNHGLEWLYRLGVEPRRMWRRYLIGNGVFLGRILREWMQTRWKPKKK